MIENVANYEFGNSFAEFLLSGHCAWVGCNRSEIALKRLKKNIPDGWAVSDLSEILNDKILMDSCEKIFAQHSHTDLDNNTHYVIDNIFIGICIKPYTDGKFIAIISDPLGNCLTSKERADLERETGHPFTPITKEDLHNLFPTL